MVGYPRTADVSDPTQPYVMFPGTPYEHLMLPVAGAKCRFEVGRQGSAIDDFLVGGVRVDNVKNNGPSLIEPISAR